MNKYIDKDKVLEYIIFGVVGKDITCGELKRGIESLPTIEVSDDAISRQALIDEILEDGNGAVLTYPTGVYEDELVEHIERQMIEYFIEVVNYMSPVEPKQPKATETMMVDGEPTEIDSLSYEIGYSHGQSERPKGEWIIHGEPPIYVRECPECGAKFHYAKEWGEVNYCSNCGCDCRGDKE